MIQLPSSLLRIAWAFTLMVSFAPRALSAAGDSAAASPLASDTKEPQLAAAYKILLTRSLFSTDGLPATIKYMPPPKPVAPATRPAAVAPPPAANPLAESNFVLKGVGIEDDLVTAFFEQISEKKMVSVRAGGTVSQGQILAMSLNGVDYASKAKTLHIVIGQSLDGRAVEVPASTAMAATKPSSAWNGVRTRGGAQDSGGAESGGQGMRVRGMGRGSQQDEPRHPDSAATTDPNERQAVEEQPIEPPYISVPSDDEPAPIIIINAQQPE